MLQLIKLNIRQLAIFKVYMTDLFLFVQFNLPNVLIGIAKKFFW